MNNDGAIGEQIGELHRKDFLSSGALATAENLLPKSFVQQRHDQRRFAPWYGSENNSGRFLGMHNSAN